MYCSTCGRELPPGSTVCPVCSGGASGPQASSSTDVIGQAVAEAKRAAKDLMEASARLSRMAIDRAEAAGKDPAGTAKKVAERVANDLESAARAVEKALKEL
jgi:hypothetical protein